MRKKTVVLLSGFFAGLLIAGIGAGIALAEYAGFDYQRIDVASTSGVSTFGYEVNLDANEQLVIGNGKAAFTSDESVPAGTVSLSMRYSSRLSEPYVVEEMLAAPADNSASAPQPARMAIIITGSASGFDTLMEHKDAILDGLKNHTLIRLDDKEPSITVTMNPADANRVMCADDWYSTHNPSGTI